MPFVGDGCVYANGVMNAPVCPTQFKPCAMAETEITSTNITSIGSRRNGIDEVEEIFIKISCGRDEASACSYLIKEMYL